MDSNEKADKQAKFAIRLTGAQYTSTYPRTLM